MIVELLLLICISYLIGAIPTGYLIGKIFYKRDIREEGSGNVGSTNMYRIFGFVPGLITQLFDIGKGIFVVLVIPLFMVNPIELSISYPLLFGTSAFLGNMRHGKGVNISFGVFMCLFPIETIFSLLFFLLCLFMTKYVSLSSMVSMVVFTIIMATEYILYGKPIDLTLISIFIILFTMLDKHSDNVKRLLEQKEPKINFKI
jgi:glycerol-3-phosphate acyltransferase PlsY